MSLPQEYIDEFDPKDHPGLNQRIIWHSVASHIRSGYGTGTRHIASRLHQLGYNIMVSAYYGIEPGGVILVNGVPHIPCARHMGSFGQGSYLHHYTSFKRTCGVLFSDFWAFPWFPGDGRFSIMYSPMDHIDYSAGATGLIRKYNRVVAFLPFQQKELRKHGIHSAPVIEHGVDRIFRPIDKAKAREETRMPQEDFIIGIVSANSDKEMRKSWGEIFMAAEYVKKEYPEIRNIKYFVHTDPEDPKGVALRGLAHKHNVFGLFAFEDTHLSVVGLPDEEMNLIYNSLDILMCPSKREGFGLPILEAMACAKPIIATNFSSMPDLVGHDEERGWLVAPVVYIDTPIIATTAIVDYIDLAEKIVQAWNSPDDIERKGKLAREFSQTLLWDDIVHNKWTKLFDECEEDQRPPDEPEIRRLEI